MKIETKQNTKKPLYAVGAALIASTLLFSACNAEPQPTEEVVLGGDTLPAEDCYKSPVTSSGVDYYDIGPGCEPVNGGFSIERYRFSGELYSYAPEDEVTENDLKEYAGTKFESVEQEREISIRGLYQGYGFEVIRTDSYREWAHANGIMGYTDDWYGAAAVGYDYPIADNGEMTQGMYFNIYLDPSGKFFVVTSCKDYKVICEFFEFGTEAEHSLMPEDYDVFCAEAFNEKFCSADAALEWAKENDVVVFEDLTCTSGRDVWDAFYLTTQESIPASVLCAFYYTLDKNSVSSELYEEEKDNYPVLYFYYITYDETYNIKTRDSSLNSIDYEYNGYLYLIQYDGENPEGAKYKYFNAFVLVDYEYITWDDISHGIYGSDTNGYVEHIIVYQDLFD